MWIDSVVLLVSLEVHNHISQDLNKYQSTFQFCNTVFLLTRQMEFIHLIHAQLSIPFIVYKTFKNVRVRLDTQVTDTVFSLADREQETCSIRSQEIYSVSPNGGSRTLISRF